MIYTGNYKNCKGPYTVSISKDKGKNAGYVGLDYPDLFPKKDFWREWKDNIGKIPEEENNRFYVRKYIEEVLANLEPYYVYKDLNGFALLCYEDNMEFCHRHIVAAWLEATLGETVPELKQTNDGGIFLPRPEYVKDMYMEEAPKILGKRYKMQV